MAKQSAGLLIFKTEKGQVKVLLGHMGGPFYTKKDEGAWDIPKGEFEGEDALEAAHREFQEEIGQPAPDGEAIALGEVKASGKTVAIWAIEGDLDVSSIKSNTFEMEWPPSSGQIQKFPEIDKAGWFDLRTAAKKIVRSRGKFLERLAENLGQPLPEEELGTTKPPQQALF